MPILRKIQGNESGLLALVPMIEKVREQLFAHTNFTADANGQAAVRHVLDQFQKYCKLKACHIRSSISWKWKCFHPLQAAMDGQGQSADGRMNTVVIK